MDNLEKVINGLKYCIDYGKRIKDICNDVPCEGCPYCKYRDIHVGFGDCIDRLHSDAIDILKAQEPRVMTLEEVLDMKFDDVVYLQVYPTNAVLSAIVIDVIPKLTEINVGVVQFRHGGGYNGINNAELNYYGKTWRCWTYRPTDEQREAVKWNDRKD